MKISQVYILMIILKNHINTVIISFHSGSWNMLTVIHYFFTISTYATRYLNHQHWLVIYLIVMEKMFLRVVTTIQLIDEMKSKQTYKYIKSTNLCHICVFLLLLVPWGFSSPSQWYGLKKVHWLSLWKIYFISSLFIYILFCEILVFACLSLQKLFHAFCILLHFYLLVHW